MRTLAYKLISVDIKSEDEPTFNVSRYPMIENLGSYTDDGMLHFDKVDVEALIRNMNRSLKNHGKLVPAWQEEIDALKAILKDMGDDTEVDYYID